ncbi:MAG TPA: hypothetical protein VN783_01270, partial [Thermoanaerobaculia bacterium]|nr:hypothetical protein [Thermoanaerobaculia bacterium]
WSMTPCGFATGGEAAVTVEQDGCAIRFTIPRLGRFAGNVADRRSDGPLALEFDPEAPGNGPACDPSSAAALDATDPERVLIPFGASPAPCCQHGMVRLSR